MSSFNVNDFIESEVKVITDTHPDGWNAILLAVMQEEPLSVQLDMQTEEAYNDVTQNLVDAVICNGVSLPIITGESAIEQEAGDFWVRTY